MYLLRRLARELHLRHDVAGTDDEQTRVFRVETRGDRPVRLPAANRLRDAGDHAVVESHVQWPDLLADRRAPLEEHARMVRMGIDAAREGDRMIEQGTRDGIAGMVMAIEQRVLEALYLLEDGAHQIAARLEVDEGRRHGDPGLG